MEALTSLLHEDAVQSMPPYSLWLSGREDILAWWLGPGIGCQGSKLCPGRSRQRHARVGQYKPAADGFGHDPWALMVLELDGGRIVELTFFLGTERIFPLFGLPPRLEA